LNRGLISRGTILSTGLGASEYPDVYQCGAIGPYSFLHIAAIKASGIVWVVTYVRCMEAYTEDEYEV
jgi:hypothetical protein